MARIKKGDQFLKWAIQYPVLSWLETNAVDHPHFIQKFPGGLYKFNEISRFLNSSRFPGVVDTLYFMLLQKKSQTVHVHTHSTAAFFINSCLFFAYYKFRSLISQRHRYSTDLSINLSAHWPLFTCWKTRICDYTDQQPVPTYNRQNWGINHHNLSAGVDTAVCRLSYWKCIGTGEIWGNWGKIAEGIIGFWPPTNSISVLWPPNDCAKFHQILFKIATAKAMTDTQTDWR